MDEMSSIAEKGDVSGVREYRKGNWSVEETAVLMEAKKMEEERRSKRGEQRWKWVEDYCCRRGCFRSQNQCNDKWDNLMRDFKKVRDYEGNYWALDKTQRKQKGLPLNMLPEIYQALLELVEKKKKTTTTPSPRIAAPPPPPTHQPPLPTPTTVDSSDSERSESESPAKRRKRKGRSSIEGIGSAISKSARIIAEAIESSEKRSREREMMSMSVHERRLQIEESKAEINRRGINSLVEAINKLADSILALAHQKQHPSK